MDRKRNERKEEMILDSDAQAALDLVTKGIDEFHRDIITEIDQSLTSPKSSRTQKNNLAIIRGILDRENTTDKLLVTNTFLIHGIHERMLYLEKVVQQITTKVQISDSELEEIRDRLDKESRKMQGLRPYMNALIADFKKRKQWLEENR